MILCVDVGNTRTKVALLRGERVVAQDAAPTRAGNYRALLERAVDAILAGAATAARGALSSVVPEATDEALAIVTPRVGTPALVVSHRHAMPVTIAVARPERVGVDRLCAASGAVDADGRDAIVVDVGSAITVDLVWRGEFRGGLIMPGPQTMLDALATRASQLPSVDLQSTGAALPEGFSTTEEAMALGVALACAGGILASVKRLESVSGPQPVWLTGGGSGWLRGELPSDWHFDPDLALRGLARIAALNT